LQPPSPPQYCTCICKSSFTPDILISATLSNVRANVPFFGWFNNLLFVRLNISESPFLSICPFSVHSVSVSPALCQYTYLCCYLRFRLYIVPFGCYFPRRNSTIAVRKGNHHFMALSDPCGCLFISLNVSLSLCYQNVWLIVRTFLRLSLSERTSLCLNVTMPFWVSTVPVSVRVFLCLSVWTNICLPVCLNFSLSMYVSVCSNSLTVVLHCTVCTFYIFITWGRTGNHLFYVVGLGKHCCGGCMLCILYVGAQKELENLDC
jgi:hypothetical protein